MQILSFGLRKEIILSLAYDINMSTPILGVGHTTHHLLTNIFEFPRTLNLFEQEEKEEKKKRKLSDNKWQHPKHYYFIILN